MCSTRKRVTRSLNETTELTLGIRRPGVPRRPAHRPPEGGWSPVVGVRRFVGVVRAGRARGTGRIVMTGAFAEGVVPQHE